MNIYLPLEDEKIDEDLSKSILSSNLMKGVYPTQKHLQILEKKYPNPINMELPKQIIEQDKKIIQISNDNYNKSQIINNKLDKSIKTIEKEINIIESSFSLINSEGGEKKKELNNKVNEFKRETQINELNSKKIAESIPELQRKKKENDEFFKKYVGEKRVWLDRLKEDNLQKLAYSDGFKYLYEAKTIKLLMEGILLEKIQDKIEKEMCEKGEVIGWGVFDEEKINKIKKKEEFELNKNLISMDIRNAVQQEKEFREKWEIIERKNERDRQEIIKQWKQIWKEIWVPNSPVSLEKDMETKRNIMIQITMKVTFDYFKKLCFDVWKFKNILLSNEEYIIMDKIRNYLPIKDSPGRTQEELILNQLMNIIESIKDEEEVIYCDLTPAKQKIEEYSKNTELNTTAIERLQIIVNEITNVQRKVNENSIALIKDDVERIKKLINEIPIESEKKLFIDHFIEEPRLFDIFLPLTNILMVVSFMTVGKKRDKIYQNKIDGANSEILKINGIINEIKGKWDLLKELNEKLGEEMTNEIIEKSQEMAENELFKSQQIIEEVRQSLNSIIRLKNQQQMNNFFFYQKLKNMVIKPKNLLEEK